MNKEQIWGVLECCLLASDDVSLGYLIKQGFNPTIAKAGIKLLNHLKSIELNCEVLENDTQNKILA
jgi:hypothetical protein